MSKIYDSKTEQIQKLEAALKRYNKAIEENHPNLANTYNLKGKTLKGLSECTGNKSYYDEAIEAFKKALEHSPNNTRYLIEISGLYELIGKADLAARYVTKSSESAKNSGGSGNRVIDMYNDIKTRNILKLEAIQQEIEILIQKNELRSEVADEFQGIIQDIKRVEQANRDYTVISTNYDNISKLHLQIDSITKTIQQLQEHYSKVKHTPEIISSLQSHIQKQLETLSQHQKETDERLEKLIIMQKVLEELKDKISTVPDFEFSKGDKAEMTEQISSIAQKVQLIAAKSDNIDTIVVSVRDLEQVGHQTKGRLRDLEKAIDRIVENHSNNIPSSSSPGSSSSYSVKLNYVDEIIYDNQLLNHPRLFGKFIGRFSLNEVVNLSQRLSEELINEAITYNNSELVLAGLVSLAESNLEVSWVN